MTVEKKNNSGGKKTPKQKHLENWLEEGGEYIPYEKMSMDDMKILLAAIWADESKRIKIEGPVRTGIADFIMTTGKTKRDEEE